jgi:hypothetical protein
MDQLDRICLEELLDRLSEAERGIMRARLEGYQFREIGARTGAGSRILRKLALLAGAEWKCRKCGESKSPDQFKRAPHHGCIRCAVLGPSLPLDRGAVLNPQLERERRASLARQRANRRRARAEAAPRRIILTDEEITLLVARTNASARASSQLRITVKPREETEADKQRRRQEALRRLAEKAAERDRRRAARLEAGRLKHEARTEREQARAQEREQRTQERAARAAARAQEREARRKQVEERRQSFLQHGTRSRYRRGCRCNGCVEASRAYERAQNLKRRLARPERQKPIKDRPPPRPRPVAAHGTRSMYVNSKCRCMECFEANRDYMNRRRRGKNAQ